MARGERGGASASASAILTINCGSSSLKFARYRLANIEAPGGDAAHGPLYSGTVDRIGLPDGHLLVVDGGGKLLLSRQMHARDHAEALHQTLDWLDRQPNASPPAAIGHRVVHGGVTFRQPQRITDEVLATLRKLVPLAPLHLPAEIAAIEALRQRYPVVPQIACFDTAFHRTMPRVAQLYGLPRRLLDAGVMRYGFHGISYEYIVAALERESAHPGNALAGQRIVIAHLGNGASMAAVRDGRSLDTTMGMTPTGGMVMSTRSGDLDPGVLLYLMESERMSARDLRATVEQRGGMLGVSGSSSDMRDLLACASDDSHAADAVALFCYTASKQLAGLVSVLDGLDLLVFTGGIGEHAGEIRRRICEPLGFLGIRLAPEANASNASVISAAASAVTVRVIPTNEELMIARHTAHALTEIEGRTTSSRPTDTTHSG